MRIPFIALSPIFTTVQFFSTRKIGRHTALLDFGRKDIADAKAYRGLEGKEATMGYRQQADARRLFGTALLVVIMAGTGCVSMTVPASEPLDLLATAPLPETEPTNAPVDANLTEIYDPWQPFNSKIHTFNNDYFDQYLMKPVAGGYCTVVDEGERRLIRNMLDHLSMPKRFINSLFQGKFGGAGRELSRFVINSTLGGLGMTDVAKYQFGIEKSDVDFGQTLQVWGWTTSRYLLVPFFPPMTVRDGVGFVVDQITSPVTYVFPLPFIGAMAKDTVAYINNRGLRLETDQDLDAPQYSDLRNSYFTQRVELIKAQ
ncbi:MAG: VacJ family lipoprotein [Nitrospirae bacterium]|nr:MAG: VacJ family lipoprotein [Nitrospirota bacterium]